MNNLFAQSRSHWVRYGCYEIKTGKDGKRYITPEKTAKPDVYNPLKESSEMVLEALNVGMLMMNRSPEDEVEKAILAFATHYGLLGLMTALPTTPSFMDYEAVYLQKNHFIKEESMATEDYLALFYPFDKLDVVKKGVESSWNVSGDNMMIALTMTFMEEPMAKNMSFQREYAEPYDWVAQQFKDWAFTLTTSILYYNDYDNIDEDTRNLYRKAMAAFGGIAPTYHIELLEKPTIYWDFHSLLLGIQMMFSFMLVDDAKLKIAVDALIPQVSSFEELLTRLQAAGYEIKPGKYVSCRAPGQERFTRLKTLGADYTEEAIRERIAGRRTKAAKAPREQRGVSLLIDIENSIKAAQSKGYEQWAKIHNLKQAAKTMNFLTEHKIEQYADLVSRIEEMAAESGQAADALKDAEKRLADMAVLIKNVSTYQKTKPVYDAYRKARNREKYRAGQEQAIILHEAAARSLKAAGIAKLPNLAALQSEYEALQAQKEALYADYGKLKKKVREYDIIKQNIDSILQADRQPEREKGTERG